jgi:hypothetical protein
VHGPFGVSLRRSQGKRDLSGQPKQDCTFSRGVLAGRPYHHGPPDLAHSIEAIGGPRAAPRCATSGAVGPRREFGRPSSCLASVSVSRPLPRRPSRRLRRRRPADPTRPLQRQRASPRMLGILRVEWPRRQLEVRPLARACTAARSTRGGNLSAQAFCRSCALGFVVQAIAVDKRRTGTPLLKDGNVLNKLPFFA